MKRISVVPHDGNGPDEHDVHDAGRPTLSVLVVDDERLVRWSISQTLAAAGDVAMEADSGDAALRLLADMPQPPDVVLLDYRLPDSDGFSLLARVRSMAPETPVIVMTCDAPPGFFAEAIRCGAWGVAIKPFDMETIRSLVHEAHLRRNTMSAEVQTPDEIIRRARAGLLPKDALTMLLAPERRAAFLAACAAIERRYTEACTAKHDPCLASGCSLDGEICLEPILRAGDEYHRACAAEWIKFFVEPEKRAV